MYLFQNSTGYKSLVILFLLSFSLAGQSGNPNVMVIPGEEYQAGSVHRFFFGDHWRDMWTTPVEVPILDLENFAGGLTPVKSGGGQQTKSLRFKNKDGIEYKFRSINKDPTKALPQEFRETFATSLVQDQTSSSHPFAPVVVEPILKALGILQAEPMLYILPDSDRLGEYKKEFAGLLGFLEIHPDEHEDEDETFANADKIAGTDKLIEELEKDNDESVKSSDYLKARLADILIGDWDRHIDQWRWARFKEGDKKYWYPIPRDRDQAFAKFDGLFPWMSSMAVTQLEHFSEEYTDIEGITWSGRHTDRRFLTSLTRSEWDSVTAFVKSRISDSVITASVKKLPAAMFEKGGGELITALKSRRDKLSEVSEDFYYQTFKYVNLHFSDKAEYAEVKRLNNNEVEVSVFDFDKNRIPKPDPLFKRIFFTSETKEIRLILNGGDDKVFISGKVDESIIIYAAGEEGKDTLIDESKVNGWFLSFIPIPDAEQKTFFMDSGDKTVFIEGKSTSVKQEKYINPDKLEPPRDWGHDWRIAPWFNVNPDDGLFLGGGAILYEFGFRRRPYVYRMELTGGYATLAQRFRLRYKAEYNPSVQDIRYQVEAKISGLEVLNYYGFGNETTFDKKLMHDNYYEVRQQQVYITPSVEFFIDANSAFTLGMQLKHADTDAGNKLFELKPYGSENILLFNLNAGYTFDSRNNKDFPLSGFYFTSIAKFFPPLRNEQSSFTKIGSEARLYFSTPDLSLSSAAIRVGGEKLWGRFPFFESAFLGGESSLRGFDRNRFAGDASIYSNLELRFYLAQTKFLLPIYYGITVLGDAGRVFYGNESSEKIRSSYGGGLWLSFIRPEYLLSIYIARSPEDTGMYLNFGFPY